MKIIEKTQTASTAPGDESGGEILPYNIRHINSDGGGIFHPARWFFPTTSPITPTVSIHITT